MAKTGKWHETLCDKHGTQEAGNKFKHKSVTCGAPKTKQQRRHGGCDACKAEKRAEQTQTQS
jgi:hypothetical protein